MSDRFTFTNDYENERAVIIIRDNLTGATIDYLRHQTNAINAWVRKQTLATANVGEAAREAGKCVVLPDLPQTHGESSGG